MPQAAQLPAFGVFQHAADKLCRDVLAPKFLVYDSGMRRLMLGGGVAGRGKSLFAISLDSGKIKPLSVGRSNALAVDADDNKLFVAVADQPRIDVLDRRSLQQIDTILLNAPACTLVYDPRDHLLVAGALGQATALIIDARQHVVVDSVVLSSPPSASLFDPSTNRAYLCGTAAAAVDVIDPAAHSVAALWQLPAQFRPSSVAMTDRPHQLTVSGGSGEIACLEADTGRLTGTAQVPVGSGSLAGEPGGRLVCAAAASGMYGVFLLHPDEPPEIAGQFTGPTGNSVEVIVPGAGISASDLYVAFVNSGGTYLQRFTLSSH